MPHLGRLAAVILVAALVLLSGCAARGKLTVRQPFAPPAQRELKLETDAAYWAITPEGVQIYVGFPLPGSKNGPRCFVLFLSTRNVEAPATIGNDDTCPARGFFIQEEGRLKGKTMLVAGTVTLKPQLLKPQERRLEISARCEDGADITCVAILHQSNDEIRVIRRQFTGDIVKIIPISPPVATQPATAPARSVP